MSGGRRVIRPGLSGPMPRAQADRGRIADAGSPSRLGRAARAAAISGSATAATVALSAFMLSRNDMSPGRRLLLWGVGAVAISAVSTAVALLAFDSGGSGA